MRQQMPLLRRFLTKLVHDVLPAALASVIGGFLFTHFQLGRVPEPAAAKAAPASAAMMQMLRDEHGLIVDFVNAQLANEKQQAQAQGGRVPAAEAGPLTAKAAPRQAVVVMAAAKPAPARGRSPVVAAALPPLVIVPAQHDGAKPAARQADSLIAKTIGIKDHVIAVTQRAVTAIGGIPSWIGSIGDRIGGDDANPRPQANLVSAS
jgi:hypothetical protein